MINKIYKRVHSRYLNIFKLFFFLKYVFTIFIIAISVFLLIPKLFDYKKKQEIIKEYLVNYYNLELNNYDAIEYKVFPLPNLSIINVNLKVQNKPVNIKSNNINIFLNFKNIYNYQNFKAKKITLDGNEVFLDISKTKDLLRYFNSLKYKLKVKNLNLNFKKKNNFLIKIKNINFSNYGYQKYQFHGVLFDKKFKASLANNNKRLSFQLLNSGIKANFEFNNKSTINLIKGSSKVSILGNLFLFNFYLNSNELKIIQSNFRNEKLSLSLDTLIKFSPFFSITSKININEIAKNLVGTINLDKILKNKEIIKKLNSEVNINYKSKKFFTELINSYQSDSSLSHGRLVFSNKIFITGGEMNCEGEGVLIDEYPRLNFICLIKTSSTKKLLRKFSISKKINDEPLNLYVEGSLNLLNKKINFKKINNKKSYSANLSDLKYFKEKFENILFDESFFKIFDKDKIKQFLLEIV